MYQESADCVSLEAACVLLSKNRYVQSFVNKAFGPKKGPVATNMMKAGKLVGELGQELHDLMYDAIHNDGAQVWSGFIRGESDNYPVRVNEYHGIFWVWAMECDPVGYFVDKNSAIIFVKSNWDNVCEEGELSNGHEGSITRSSKVSDYLPGGPEAWLDLPAELVVSFQLSEYGSVGAENFAEFSRNSLKEALRVVCAPRKPFALLSYTLVAREIALSIRWDADGALARYGRQAPLKRGKDGSKKKAEVALVKLFQFLPVDASSLAPHPFHEPIVRLRVGGQTSEEAVINWHNCARVLRKWKKEFDLPTSVGVAQTH